MVFHGFPIVGTTGSRFGSTNHWALQAGEEKVVTGISGRKTTGATKKSETPKMEKRNHLPARPEEKKPQVPPGKGRHFGDGHRICV